MREVVGVVRLLLCAGGIVDSCELCWIGEAVVCSH
jgi:hypothetical protein